MAAGQKAPAPPVSWLLLQGDERYGLGREGPVPVHQMVSAKNQHAKAMQPGTYPIRSGSCGTAEEAKLNAMNLLMIKNSNSQERSSPLVAVSSDFKTLEDAAVAGPSHSGGGPGVMKHNWGSQDCTDGFITGSLGGGGRAAEELLESPPWDMGQKAWSRLQAAGGNSWAWCDGKLQKWQERDEITAMTLVVIQDIIDLEDLCAASSIGLRLVLEYLYTANVTLSLDTVEEVLSVSKILHIPQVTKLCVQFLNDQISVQNYKQVCKIAALHGLEETKKLANKYLVEDVLLLNFEEMRALLDSLPPPVESELALFQMSVLWLEHDRETRMQYAPDLMKRLRFALIPAPELVERAQLFVGLQRLKSFYVMRFVDVSKIHCPITCSCWVWAGLLALFVSTLPSVSKYLKFNLALLQLRIRSNKKMLLLVGGLPPGPDRLPSNLVQYYDDEKKTWKILTIMPYNSAHHCVVEVENFLFVLGGEDQWNPNGKHSTNFVSRYDPRFNSWIQLPPMQERRASFYACRLDKNLYVIGGRNETGYLSSVECYNLETNEWRYVSSLPQPLAAHAGAVHNGKIYISGGVHNGEYVPWLYCYDPVMDVWARKQDMNTKRAIHTLAVMNDRLYAIGGNHLKGFSHLDVMLVECYDPKGDQWNILQTPILEGRSGPGCAVLDDSIYLVGGYSWSMGAYKSSTICYSPEKGTWTELEGDVAEPLAGPACSTVILPACVPYNK
ncbi:kelch-like protein 14 [Egretta garzetta]|uniref:kelch-like protein 14 n=1 Tax=Egretta garzetta TaxID=188379 RepID=UPI00163C6235|nr:kelch-like protein 14 [Egretta garzetta]